MSSSPATPNLYDANAIAARQAEIVGRPQRVPSLSESALGDDAKAAVMHLREGIGLPPTAKLPDYCYAMLHSPEFFRCQMEMGAAIFRGRIAPRERELAVLRIGWLMRAPYEWGEHVNISKCYGVSAEEVQRVISGSKDPSWTQHEATILRAVEEMLSDHAVTDETWAQLASVWDHETLVEFTAMTGQYIASALIQNVLRLRLEPDNPGLINR